MSTAVAPAQGSVAADSRMAAFLAPDCAEIFHAVATPNAIWKADAYDVETIHAEAHAAFEHLLNRAGRTPPPPAWAVLVLLVEAGSGKTHLMRAFRARTHGQGLGYCGYFQMTAVASNYARYMLNNLMNRLVAVCNATTRGTAFHKQVSELENRAGEIPVAIVRTTEFPKTGKAITQIARMLKLYGQKVVAADAEWRRMLAFEAFRKCHGQRSDFAAWQKAALPLGELDSLQKILNLSAIATTIPRPVVAPPPPGVPPTRPEPARPAPAVAAPAGATNAGALILGRTVSVTPSPVTFEPNEFVQHAAFLGGTGSGKTTAALNLNLAIGNRARGSVDAERGSGTEPALSDDPPVRLGNVPQGIPCGRRRRDKVGRVRYESVRVSHLLCCRSLHRLRQPFHIGIRVESVRLCQCRDR
jgi:hypothetical protein